MISREALDLNLQAVRRRMIAASQRAGRRPDEVNLVAVTKGVPLDLVSALPSLGVKIAGENRVQEAETKVGAVPSLAWHLIGSLQTNKAKKALGLFQVIQTVDRLDLAAALLKGGRPAVVMLQVNISGETSKHGLAPEETPDFLALIRRDHPLLRVVGLMGMAPQSPDPETSRPFFRRLYELARRLELPSTSMGMSDDFEIAIEEGATHVRVGTAIFGPR